MNKTQVLLMNCLTSINKVYSLVAQEESNCSPTPITDHFILTNAYDVKKSYGWGKCMNNGKHNSWYCTHYHRYDQIMEFSYQKHGHPNINKLYSYTNIVTNSQHPNPNSDLNQ